MPLSRHEQRLLEDIEQRLRRDDPAFADALAANATDPDQTRPYNWNWRWPTQRRRRTSQSPQEAIQRPKTFVRKLAEVLLCVVLGAFATGGFLVVIWYVKYGLASLTNVWVD